jgi:hypothetical protein
MKNLIYLFIVCFVLMTSCGGIKTKTAGLEKDAFIECNSSIIHLLFTGKFDCYSTIITVSLLLPLGLCKV